MKILGCKVAVSKRLQIAIEQIERFDGGYEIILKDGFKFSNGDVMAIVKTQKELKDTFNAIVMPEKEAQKPAENVEKEIISTFREAKVINEFVNKDGKKVTVYAPTGRFTKKAKKKKRTKKAPKLAINRENRETQEVQIVYLFLKGEKTMQALYYNFSKVMVEETLVKYALKPYNRGNFAGLSNAKIFATLKFYKRNDLIAVFEKSYLVVVA